MRVTWDSRVGRLEIEGSHKKGTPRIWTISVQAYKGDIRENLLVLLTALDAIVRDELRELAVAR